MEWILWQITISNSVISCVLQCLKSAVRPAVGWKPAAASYDSADKKDGLDKEDKTAKEGTEMKLFLPNEEGRTWDV